MISILCCLQCEGFYGILFLWNVFFQVLIVGFGWFCFRLRVLLVVLI